jgi:hypothetical protein
LFDVVEVFYNQCRCRMAAGCTALEALRQTLAHEASRNHPTASTPLQFAPTQA